MKRTDNIADVTEVLGIDAQAPLTVTGNLTLDVLASTNVNPLYGVRADSNVSLTGGSVNVKLEGGQNLTGVYVGAGGDGDPLTLTFGSSDAKNTETTITATTTSKDSTYSTGIGGDNDYVDNIRKLFFNSPSTKITVKNNQAAYGVDLYNAEFNFNGDTSIKVEAGSGRAFGFNAQSKVDATFNNATFEVISRDQETYGISSTDSSFEFTNLTIKASSSSGENNITGFYGNNSHLTVNGTADISATSLTTKEEVRAIQLLYGSTATFARKATITATAQNSKTAYGVEVIRDNSSVVFNGGAEIDVSIEHSEGKAFGVFAEFASATFDGPTTIKVSGNSNAEGLTAKYSTVTLNGETNVAASGLGSTGVGVTDSTLNVNHSLNATGELDGIFIWDGELNLNRLSKVTTNRMTARDNSTTNLLNGATLAITGAQDATSKLGHVNSEGGILEFGQGTFDMSSLKATGAQSTTISLLGTAGTSTDTVVMPKVTIGDKSGNVDFVISGALNDRYGNGNAESTAKAMADSVSVTNVIDGTAQVKVVGQEGNLADAFTANLTLGSPSQLTPPATDDGTGDNTDQGTGDDTSPGTDADTGGNANPDGNTGTGGTTVGDVVVTPNTKLAGYRSIAALGLVSWRHEMNDLQKRLGELRMSPEGVGAWARLYGSEQEYGSQNVTSKNKSIQVGADTDIGNGWKVGGAFIYTDGDVDYDSGNADSNAYSLAVYGTWMNESGLFVDLIGKYTRLSTDFKAGTMAGDFDNNALSLSAEAGWHFKVNDQFFVEPQAELTLGRVKGASFTADNGVKVKQKDTDSIIGRVGVRTGYYLPDNKGTVYARLSGVHDFDGKSKSRFSYNGVNRSFTEDLGGSWVEMGVGANYNVSDKAYVYADLQKTAGGEVKENWRFNVGMRYVF